MHFVTRGIQVSGKPFTNHLNIVPTINKLRSESHASKVPVFFLKIGHNDDFSDVRSFHQNDSQSQYQSRKQRAIVSGTWDAEMLADLAPDPRNPNEMVVEKTRGSGFWHTEFGRLLQVGYIN